MNDPIELESQIQNEVENLRAQFSNTRDLYREVCALLFFRYGITPTTNKLYQYVRKGSMSVPTEVLSNFWKELRDKSKVAIAQPDLPKDLSHLAGEAIATLWTKAQLVAQESLAAFRREAEQQILKLEAERDDGLLRLEAAEKERLKQIDELSNSETQNRLLIEERESLKTNRQSLEAEIEKMKGLIDEVKASAQMEVNREKSISAKLDEELMGMRIAYESLQSQHKLLNTQMGDLREEMGILNGKLHMAHTINEQLHADIASKESKLNEIMAKWLAAEQQPTSWKARFQQKNKKLNNR